MRWVVDPLDGTTNYLYGFPGFNVSIAAEVDGAAVAGAVYDVVRDELFSAHLGGGATRDGAPIAASGDHRAGPRAGRHRVLLRPGAPAAPGRGARRTCCPAVRDIRRQGAAALDLCSVACGRLDAYYERGLAPWDLAAGGLVATEAGRRRHRPRPAARPAPDSVLAAAPGHRRRRCWTCSVAAGAGHRLTLIA